MSHHDNTCRTHGSAGWLIEPQWQQRSTLPHQALLTISGWGQIKTLEGFIYAGLHVERRVDPPTLRGM
jgi:hypothetical protein